MKVKWTKIYAWDEKIQNNPVKNLTGILQQWVKGAGGQTFGIVLMKDGTFSEVKIEDLQKVGK